MQPLKIVLADAQIDLWTFVTPEAISRKFRWSFTWRRLVILPIVWKVFLRPHYLIKLCNKENEKANFPTSVPLASNTTPSLISYPSKRLLPQINLWEKYCGLEICWRTLNMRCNAERNGRSSKPASHGRWVSCKLFRSFCKVLKTIVDSGLCIFFPVCRSEGIWTKAYGVCVMFRSTDRKMETLVSRSMFVAWFKKKHHSIDNWMK